MNVQQQQLLDWVNGMVNGDYTKIEDLRSGVAYCQLMEMLFPHSIGGIRKINKSDTDLDCVFRYNLKLVQDALIKLQFEKIVPVDRLMSGNFKDNLKFLQWFKIFYDTHSTGHEDFRLPTAPSRFLTRRSSSVQTS